MLKTILVPLDGSPLAERALPFAAGLAQQLSAKVLLVRASVDVNEVNLSHGELLEATSSLELTERRRAMSSSSMWPTDCDRTESRSRCTCAQVMPPK